MVNASLNWASIVGIVLAVGGALLYFMRSFKPALARDYDVFFAAVGLLCGGILFFQGWRLDPILQFGQFLLAGTTVFFAYESVRLRGVTTEQARRSSYFDDEEPLPPPPDPYRPRVSGRGWDGPEADRFDEPRPVRRRIPVREPDDETEDFYRPRRSARVAIPERAASRRLAPDSWDDPPSSPQPTPSEQRRYSAGAAPTASEFGSRRRDRDSLSETRRGSRPTATGEAIPRSSRRPTSAPAPSAVSNQDGRPGVPQGAPIRSGDATSASTSMRDAEFTPVPPRSVTPNPATPRPASPSPRAGDPPVRDNSSRFDD